MVLASRVELVEGAVELEGDEGADEVEEVGMIEVVGVVEEGLKSVLRPPFRLLCLGEIPTSGVTAAWKPWFGKESTEFVNDGDGAGDGDGAKEIVTAGVDGTTELIPPPVPVNC
jgi:hypothetical protein